MKKIFFLLVLLGHLTPSFCQFSLKDVPDSLFKGFNNPVNAIAYDSLRNVIYVGGSFTAYKPYTSGALIDTTTDIIDTSFSKVNGSILVAISDGNGGLFIGGDFSMVGDSLRNNLAQINSSGQVTKFNPGADNLVRCLGLFGNTLFAGGSFGRIGGQLRSGIAAIDMNTGLSTTWNCNTDNTVMTLAISGDTLYIGGWFNNAGGQVRSRIASISTNSGLLHSWNPNSAGCINSIIVVGNNVYAAGCFTSIGGQSRNHAAALDRTTGNVTGWNPNVDNLVATLSSHGNLVYIGGYFQMVGGQARHYVASVNINTGAVTAWNPNPDNAVMSILATNNTTVYVGGAFRNIGGISCKSVAKINSNTGNAYNWSPNKNEFKFINSLMLLGNKLFAGADLGAFGGQKYNFLVAINATTGLITSWNPSPPGGINGLWLNGDTLYVAGGWNTLRSIDLNTGSLTSWNPNADDNVNSVFVTGNTVYVGGMFKNIGGQPRNRIAAIDKNTGLATSWNPNADYPVETMTVSGGTLYLGGEFLNISGQPRNHLAAIDINTGVVTPWNPNADNTVYTFFATRNTLYVGGNFLNIGGQNHTRVASIDATTGIVNNWNPNANAGVKTILKNGNSIFISGDFTSVGGQNRNYIASVDENTGLANSWNPNANKTVTTIASDGKSIYIGGNFSYISGEQFQHFFAKFSSSCNFSLTNAVKTIPAGCNFTNGRIEVSISGVNSPFTYQWSPLGGTTSIASGIGSSNYSITVTDASGCSDVLPVILDDSCDYIWPGDANADGVADNLDFLSIGLGYGRTGFARSSPSINWVGQPCNNWIDTLPNGADFKHIDCNGDGTINNYDTTAVILNYGLVHNKKNEIQYIANTDIYLDISFDTVTSGGTLVIINIGLGTNASPASNIYGSAFTINFSDPTLIIPNSISFKGENSWLGTLGTDLMAIGVNKYVPNSVDVALTRIDQQNKSGYGIIATLRFKTSNSLNGTGNLAQLMVNISKATVISNKDSIIPVNTISDSVIIKDILLPTGINNLSSSKSIIISPNPFNGIFKIESVVNMEEIEIMNLLGEKIYSSPINSHKWEIILTKQPEGIYFIQIQTPNGIAVKKIVKD